MYKYMLFFIMILFIAACTSNEQASSVAPQSDILLPPVENQEKPADDHLIGNDLDSSTLPETQITERMVLKNAILSLIVQDAVQTIDTITRIADDMGGWVVSANVSTYLNFNSDEAASGSITLRIPAERLNEALDQIKAGAIKVQSEQTTGEDVTAEYVDLSSDLENLQASENQLQTIMDSATTVEDVLNVRAELERVRGEINRIQGRLRYFRESAAYSLITVQLSPQTPESVEDDTWRPLETAEDAFDNLVEGLQGLADAIIWVTICGMPFVILLGLPGFMFYRRRMKKT